IENIRLQANILLIPEYYKKLINEPFILQVARLDPIKNHLEMIEIFYQLKQKGVKEKLYLIGEGEARNELEDKIKELELENDCLLLGKIENPFPFMQQAKLFIHTSKIEGLPTVLIESMACGTPVVAYDCPFGPKEILADGKYGELIPLHDKELFVQATYDLLTDENKRQHYIRLLPEAVKRFNFQTIGNKLEVLLDNL
ncbi:glycosyltransferase, partial [Haemophilus parahaemolyticus]|uniref:glycosyltransferase n=1 Tax=Haemophilus parahaemolyticus TaxID=735 RepID=UPI0028EB9DFB